jgi:DNA-binding transcriptional MerR regulator
MPRRAATQPGAIPDKQYFRIGEVATILGVKTSVLRFWETEFRAARAEKTASNQRRYSRKQVERLLAIRELLYVRGFTIAGAKKALREDPETEEAPAPAKPTTAWVKELRREVEELLQLVAE